MAVEPIEGLEDPAALAAALARRGSALVRVATGSMAPAVPAGALVRVSVGAARVGDVVLVRTASAMLLHRLVARIAVGPYARFVQAGDAGDQAGLCRPSQVLAIADLPRRVPALPRRVWLSAIALGRGLAARVRVR